MFLLDEQGKLVGAVPLSKLVLADRGEPLLPLSLDPLISVHAGASEQDVAEMFDKYNLLTLPVVDQEGRVTGVITADDIISLLRSKQ
jgi:Mg/Co/Ni transporter MgtE